MWKKSLLAVFSLGFLASCASPPEYLEPPKPVSQSPAPSLIATPVEDVV